jgi:N utilization substance protein A
VKNIEDFAGYAVDDLVGWRERKDGETVNHSGILSSFDVSRVDAEQMILTARLKAGWITEEELVAVETNDESEAGEEEVAS